MRLNLNDQRDSNILTLFGNGITECNVIPIIVTLIAFDLIYSEFSEGYPNPFLGVVTTPPAFIYYPPLIIPTTLFI